MENKRLSFNCTHCNKQLFIGKIPETSYGKNVSVKCLGCNKLSGVKIPDKQKLEALFNATNNQKNLKDTQTNTVVNSNTQQLNSIFLEVIKNEFTPFQKFEIDNTMSIGRKSSSPDSFKPDIPIITDDTYMSRKHAIIFKHPNNKFSLADLGSMNKVYHNGVLLEPNEEVYLNIDDEIKLGKTTFKISKL